MANKLARYRLMFRTTEGDIDSAHFHADSNEDPKVGAYTLISELVRKGKPIMDCYVF